MLKRRSLFLLSLASFVLCSCGYSTEHAFKGNAYNSSVFWENYYQEWNSKIDKNASNNKITETKEVRVLDDSKDMVFTSFKSTNFSNCDSNINYDFLSDTSPSIKPYVSYGQSIRMANIDKSFRYGVISKLYDGQMYCHQQYQISRVQVAPKDCLESNNKGGFGALFDKEMTKGQYFIMFFKLSTLNSDYSIIKSDKYIYSDVSLNITFYCKNGKGYTAIPVTYSLNNIVNNSDSHYVPFGFKLHQNENDDLLDLNRLAGYSIEYTVNDVREGDTILSGYKHALMLYELSFPFSTWH